jgi:hypothetical protein
LVVFRQVLQQLGQPKGSHPVDDLRVLLGVENGDLHLLNVIKCKSCPCEIADEPIDDGLWNILY